MVLAWENLQWGFCDVGCCSSFIAVFVMLLVVYFYVSGLLFHATGTPHWLLRHMKVSASSELYPGYFRLPYFSVTFLSRALRFWVGIFYPQAFFFLRSFPTFFPQPAFIKTSLGAGNSSLKFSGLHAGLQGFEVCRTSGLPRNTDLAHLLVWFTAIHNLDIQKNPYLNRIKYFHKLLVVKSLFYLLLTRSELFSLVQSICKDYKKHFEQGLYCLKLLPRNWISKFFF